MVPRILQYHTLPPTSLATSTQASFLIPPLLPAFQMLPLHRAQSKDISSLSCKLLIYFQHMKVHINAKNPTFMLSDSYIQLLLEISSCYSHILNLICLKQNFSFSNKLFSQASPSTYILKPETKWSVIYNFSFSFYLYLYSIQQQIFWRPSPKCVLNLCTLCCMPPALYYIIHHTPIILPGLPFSVF